MSSLTLEVECMVGTDIKTCIEDALELCKQLDLGYVKFNFNGSEVHVGQSCWIYLALGEWKEKGGCKQKFYVFN